MFVTWISRYIQRSVLFAVSRNRGRSWNLLPVDTGLHLYFHSQSNTRTILIRDIYFRPWTWAVIRPWLLHRRLYFFTKTTFSLPSPVWYSLIRRWKINGNNIYWSRTEEIRLIVLSFCLVSQPNIGTPQTKPYIIDAPSYNVSVAAPSPCIVTRVWGLADWRAVMTGACVGVVFRPFHHVLLFWGSLPPPTPPQTLNSQTHFIQCLKSFSLSRLNRKIF
jgi:hypothetical protein